MYIDSLVSLERILESCPSFSSDTVESLASCILLWQRRDQSPQSFKIIENILEAPLRIPADCWAA